MNTRINLLLIGTAAFIIGFVSLILFPEPVSAATCIWNGNTDNQWTTASNWSFCGGNTPGAGDTASIVPVGTGKYYPVLNSNTQVNTLQLNAGAYLTIAGGNTLTAGVVSLNGNLSGNGQLVVTTTLYWAIVEAVNYGSDGRLSGGGKLTLQAGANGYLGTLGYEILDGWTLENYGTLQIYDPSASVVITMASLSSIHNYGVWGMDKTLVEDEEHNSVIYNHTGGSLLLQNIPNNYAVIMSKLDNDGEVNILGGLMEICRGSGTQDGHFHGGVTSEIYFGDCPYPADTWNFSTSSSITVAKVTFGGYQSYQIHGTYGPLGTSTFTSSWATAVVFHPDSTILSLGHSVEGSGFSILGGATNIQVLQLIAGPTFNTQTTITVYNSFTCVGKYSGGNMITVLASGQIALNTNCELDNITFNNNGTATWGTYNISGKNNASFINRNLLRSTGTNTFSGGSEATLSNLGSFVKTGAGTTSTVGVNFDNQNGASVRIESGTLVFSAGTIFQDGSQVVLAGGNLQVNHGMDLFGILNGNGSLQADLTNRGEISPGNSAGQILVQGSYTQTQTAELEVELGGIQKGVTYDSLTISGQAILSGTLNITLLPGFTPSVGDTFTILTASGGIIGQFQTLNLPSLPTDYRWDTHYDTTSVWLEVLGPNPQPLIWYIQPNGAVMGGDDFTLEINGEDFVSGAWVEMGDDILLSNFVSTNLITATVPQSMLTQTGTLPIWVINPEPGGGWSNISFLFVTQTGAEVSDFETESSDDPMGSATASTGGSGPSTPGSVTATAQGAGHLVVARYTDNPGGTPSFYASGAYMDVNINSDHNFTSITIENCDLRGGMEVYWWNGTVWALVSNQVYNPATGCVTMILDNTTSPSVNDLTGTPFGVAGGSIYLPLIRK